VACFLLSEALLRVVYRIRNARLDYVPLPYTIGGVHGPVPPWLDGTRILEPDGALAWRLKRNNHRKYIDLFSPVEVEADRDQILRRFRPAIPPSLQGNPVWEISVNSSGFRDKEFPKTKSASAFRILCLGDSWTFGTNVGQDQSYPWRLGALLAQEFPQAQLEVFNLGVPGYSSHHGLELMRSTAAELNPDLVTVAFAMNDARIDEGYRDKDIARLAWLNRIRRVAPRLESLGLLQYLFQAARFRPSNSGRTMGRMAAVAGGPDEAWFAREGLETADYQSLEASTRVTPWDYESNIVETIRLARDRGAGVILVYNHLWATQHRQRLEKISQAQGVPLVDGRALVAAARARIEKELEEKLSLRPAQTAPAASAAQEIEVVFRVYSGKYAVPKAIYISGTDVQLGDSEPNRVLLYDDGTHGDQKAGDKVWSYAATMAPGRKFYVYTNSGAGGRWEGLDVPDVRSFTVPAGGGERKVYRPIETFGELYMQADAWHTNAVGYDLIARALLESLKQTPRFQQHVRR